MKKLIYALATMWMGTMAFGEPAKVEWVHLIDQEAQNFEDPYKSLTNGQIGDLVTLVRLRERLNDVELPNDEKSKLDVRVNELESSLLPVLTDIDWYISQRWVVAERREKAAWAGNQEFDGKQVTLTGFAIPAPQDTDGFPTAYLVPERGMCSHMPPPPPNQMVHVRLPKKWKPSTIYEPMQLSGTLSIAPSEQQIIVVDGPVPMRATFAMEVDHIQPYSPSQPTGKLSWVEELRAKLGANPVATE
ncbi:DUF3299 domain-containing protein [Primorskyibacter sp. S87]|uniref:DUF3299 domain-containing protein n=1 Tax=Primorskyibacter sp. S87 TaxID=3415126 RepID=UPI003C7D7DD4